MLLTLFKHFKHKKANLSRARAHLLLNYTQYMTVSSFRCIFRNICHFYTSYLYLYMYTVIAKFAGHAHGFLTILSFKVTQNIRQVQNVKLFKKQLKTHRFPKDTFFSTMYFFTIFSFSCLYILYVVYVFNVIPIPL